MMSNPSRNQSIANLARDTLAEVAPEELPAFEPRSKAYFRNPSVVLNSGQTQDREGGFGGGVGEAAISWILLWLAGKILDLAWELVSEPIKPSLQEMVKRFLRKIKLMPPQKPSTFPELNATLLKQLNEKTLIVFQPVADQYHIPEVKIVYLVNTMIEQIKER